MKWQDVKKLLIGGSVVGIVTLFSALFLLTGVSYTHSGDIECGEVCESYINITTTYWRICFDSYDDTKYENETLFKKQTRSRTLHVNLDKVDNIIHTEPEVEVDWLVPTYGNKWRPIKNGDCWDRGKVNKIKLVGYKEPTQTVKWSFDVGDKVNIDPVWYGEDGRVVSYTSTTDTVCADGICTKTLYSGVRNAYEDDQWKRIENAKSLKGYFKKIYLNNDSNYKIEIDDFNYTCIKKLKIKSGVSGNIPFKLNDIEYISPYMEEGVEIELEDICIDNILSYNFTLGESSTTIQLLDNETENLADLSFDDGTSSGFQMKWNITSVPEGQTIDDSVLCTRVISIFSGGPDDDVRVWRINDQGWDESSNAATLESQSLTNQIDETFSSIASGTFFCVNVTEMIKTDYNLGNDNASIRLEDVDNLVGTIDTTGDGNLVFGIVGGIRFEFISREYVDFPELRPYLNITYSELVPSVYSLNITDPITGDAKSVSSGDNITITFNFTADNVALTSGVTMNNVTIGGSYADILASEAPLTITLVGQASDNTDNEASVVVDVSGIDIQDDDLILFFGSADGTGYDMVSGFTPLQDTATGGTHTNILGYKIASSEPSSYAVNVTTGTERGIAIFAVYRGVDTGDPIDASNTNTGGSDQIGVITSITPTDDNSLVAVFIGTEDGNAGNPFTSNWPSSLVEQLDNVNGPPGTGAASSAGAFADVLQTSKSAVSGSITLGGAGGTTFWGVMAVVLNAGTGEIEEFGYYGGAWNLNVTVPTFASGLKDLFVNATYSGNSRSDTETNAINYGVTDTCTYTSGDWNVDCADDCLIESPVIGDGSDFFASGSGTFTMTTDVSGFANYYLLDNCDAYCLGGCFV